jgi:hypothetical protein
MRRTPFRTIAFASLLLGCNGITGPQRFDGAPPVFSFEYPSSVVQAAFQASLPSQPAGTLVGVRLTNTGTTPATVEHGACSVAVWLYRGPAPSARPVWQNRLPANAACITIALSKTIVPGASYDVGGAIVGSATLGDSLPAGRYFARVAVTRRMPGSTSDGRLVVLDAGAVDLIR